MRLISTFYQAKLHHEDRLILNLVLTLIFCGLIGIALNAVTFQYKGGHYLSPEWFLLVPAFLVMIFFSVIIFKKHSKIAFLSKSYGLYFLTIFAFLVMITGIQYTPFPTVDPFLASTDQFMRIKETTILDWTFAHPLILKILRAAYHLEVYQLIAIPLLLFLLGKKIRIYFYLVTSLIAYIIGSIIYYIFPTMGPAGVFSDPNFNAAQIDIALKFKEIHQYLLVTTFDGAIITFPSFHVLWAIIAIYTLRKTPLWFYLPLLALNSIAVIANLFLGWNYAIDIIGGACLGLCAIYLAKRLLRNSVYSKQEDSAVVV